MGRNMATSGRLGSVSRSSLSLISSAALNPELLQYHQSVCQTSSRHARGLFNTRPAPSVRLLGSAEQSGRLRFAW
jgi:hypothetical protein